MTEPKKYKDYNDHHLAEEMALVAVVLSDVLIEPLYKTIKTGYIATVTAIRDLSIAFIREHMDTNWVDDDVIWDDHLHDWASEELVKAENDPTGWLVELQKRRGDEPIYISKR